ncbi:hypothetical protein I4U23_007418 [Adineta vaga]|nr:hypothetical protein I4U23_007418 [Adineta vaga]
MMVHQSVQDPTGFVHRWVMDFELAFFDKNKFNLVKDLMENWWWLSLVYAILYIVLVFIGRAWMSKRKDKFELRGPLILWNAGLTIFSLWGACRCVPELIHALMQHGFMYSVCDRTYMKGITGLWVWLFMASKVPETIDTLFIVLRRQQLIFLHWYHHASVLIYCFYSYALFASTGRWFVSMNYCVHTIMYGYFALRAARIHVPGSVQATITLLQLIQMIGGCTVNISAFYYKKNGHYCSTDNTNIVLSLALYASYLLLFAHFFYNSYVRKDSKKSDKKQN